MLHIPLVPVLVLRSVFGLWLLGFLLFTYSKSLKHLYGWCNTWEIRHWVQRRKLFSSKKKNVYSLNSLVRMDLSLPLSSNKIKNSSNISVFLHLEFCWVTSLFRCGFYSPFCSLATHKTSLWNSPVACNKHGWCRAVQKLSVGC